MVCDLGEMNFYAIPAILLSVIGGSPLSAYDVIAFIWLDLSHFNQWHNGPLGHLFWP